MLSAEVHMGVYSEMERRMGLLWSPAPTIGSSGYVGDDAEHRRCDARLKNSSGGDVVCNDQARSGTSKCHAHQDQGALGDERVGQ